MRALVALALVGAAAAAVAAPADKSPDTPADDVARVVERMANVGGVFAFSFAPDGKRLAIVANLSGSPQIWTIPSEGGWPEQVTALADPVGGVAWSPDGNWIAFTLAPGGGMNAQVYRVHPDGTGLERLTAGGKETNVLGAWSHDGRVLVYGSNRRSGTGIDSYVYDGDSSRLAIRSNAFDSINDLARDRRRALVARRAQRGDNNLYLSGLDDGKETLLTPHEGTAESFGQLAPDGRTLYLASDIGGDRSLFARVRLGADGKPGAFERLRGRDDAELDRMVLDDAGKLAALSWNVGGKSELEIFDLARGRVVAHPKLPAERVLGATFSRDGKRLAVSLMGAAAPADLYMLDVRSGAMRQVTRMPHAGVDLAQLVRPELVSYRGHDGLALTAWLYRPRDTSGPVPMVLSFHGGPEGQELPLFNATYQALLARGIAVMAPNVRGSTGFGKRFMSLDNGALRADAVKDIRASVEAAVRAGADARRIGIMGGSYGGYMVMAGLTEYPDLFAAGADLYGVVNFETFFKHTEAWMAAISTSEYGDPKTEADLLRRLSPINKLDRVKAPTLVLHGANDTNVPVIEAEQVVAALKKRNVPVDYVLFPDEGHGWRKLPNRIRSATTIVRWFERYLKPGRS